MASLGVALRCDHRGSSPVAGIEWSSVFHSDRNRIHVCAHLPPSACSWKHAANLRRAAAACDGSRDDSFPGASARAQLAVYCDLVSVAGFSGGRAGKQETADLVAFAHAALGESARRIFVRIGAAWFVLARWIDSVLDDMHCGLVGGCTVGDALISLRCAIMY